MLFTFLLTFGLETLYLGHYALAGLAFAALAVVVVCEVQHAVPSEG